MGWKCPICLQDFGKDKSAQEKHIKEAHNGAGVDVLKVLKNVVGDSGRTHDDLAWHKEER